MANTTSDDVSEPTADVTRDEQRLTVSFEDFYESEYRRVVGVVFGLSGSRLAAEEITQEAFIKAHANWSELSSHPNRQAWVRRVAINKALSSLRRQATEAKVLLRIARERPRIEELPEAAEAIWEAVRDLPRNQAIAIALRYQDGLPVDQIAEVLGCKPATVRVHLHRGRVTLADHLGAEPVTENDPADDRTLDHENPAETPNQETR